MSRYKYVFLAQSLPMLIQYDFLSQVAQYRKAVA